MKTSQRNQIWKLLKSFRNRKFSLECWDFHLECKIYLKKPLLSIFPKNGITIRFEVYPNAENFIENTYPNVEKISVDNGILEKADNVHVILQQI